MTCILRWISIVVASFLWANAPAHASGYIFSFLNDFIGHGMNNSGQVAGYAVNNPLGGIWSEGSIKLISDLEPTDINDSGQLVGRSNFLTSVQPHAILWNGTAAINLGTLGGAYSAANGINNFDEVVGEASTANGETHAALWNGSKITDLGLPNGVSSAGGYSSAKAINDSGKAVGLWTDVLSETHAVLWDGKNATELKSLGGIYRSAHSINNFDYIVGSSQTSGGEYHAVLWEGTKVIDLGTSGTVSAANAINNLGQVVGNVGISGEQPHATLWNGTVATDLNSFLDPLNRANGWVLASGSDINDKGWIIGSAENRQAGIIQSFLLIPNLGASPANPIMPIVELTDGWAFVFTYEGGTIWIDPLVATGYDYLLDSGPNFTSVLLPNAGDDQFSLYLWNGTEWTFDSTLNAGVEHTFSGAGVDRFRITGIETSAGLDPRSATAFVTGLTFADTGQASMHMTALVQIVPEPETYAMLLAGAGLVGFMSRRKQRMASI
jgi:probable HAF family extracellular repeat protein